MTQWIKTAIKILKTPITFPNSFMCKAKSEDKLGLWIREHRESPERGTNLLGELKGVT